MSFFVAKLNFEDDPAREFEILQCNYFFHQKTDNKDNSNVPSWTISIQIRTSPDDFLIRWMTNRYRRRTGNITFFKIAGGDPTQRITFTSAYCLEYHTHFNAGTASSMITSIILSADHINICEMEND